MADATTTTYGLTKPEIGASEDTWGTKTNENWDSVDDLLDGTTAISPNLTALKIGGSTVTATVTELNYVDGVTSAIQTQLDAKAPLASPALTGTPTAPTASLGTNTTQIATTAFVTAALQAAYPVGSIYINAAVDTNPATLLGFGTWTAFGAGKVLVGQDTGDSSFDTLQETGGSKDAIVVSHTHTATSTVTDPGHDHGMVRGAYPDTFNNTVNVPYDSSTGTSTTQWKGTTGITVATSVASSGSSGTNANLQPYIVVKMWRRTA
jgi:hypothetical protein